MSPTLADVLLWVGCLLVVAGATGKAWPLLRRLVHTFDLIESLPARLDSLEGKVNAIVHETTYNGGTSMKDALRRIEHQLEQHIVSGRAETDQMWSRLDDLDHDDN